MTTYGQRRRHACGHGPTKPYTVVILHAGPTYGTADVAPVLWENRRRNFGLRADGALNIVCPVLDDSDVCGIGILDSDPDPAHTIMATIRGRLDVIAAAGVGKAVIARHGTAG